MMQTQWRIITVLAATIQAVFAAPNEGLIVASSKPKSTVPGEITSPEKPFIPMKITEMLVCSKVKLRYARTKMVTCVHNPDARAQEYIFHVLLSENAFISGFTMNLKGVNYKAYVKEKKEAEKMYNQAVSEGISAAQVATTARDSNQFMVSANIEGNSTAEFVLRWEEFLERRNGLYNCDINLHPGTFVPKLKVVVNIKEPQRITKLSVPEIKTGNEVDARETDPQNTKVVIVRGADNREVTITFTPDLEEQKRLAEIYEEKSKEKGSLGSGKGKGSKQNSVTLGQFVVQYDVEQSNNGEIFVNEGYFAHFLAPSSLNPLSKCVIFVLDTSGSMMGRKIEQLRSAMIAILSDLNPNDRFILLEFNSVVTIHDLNKSDQTPPSRSATDSRNTNVTLVPPSIASPENIAKAKNIVSGLKATGGTNIYEALVMALNLLESEDMIIFDTDCYDGYFYYEDILLEQNNAQEPIIIFLTDGEPTVGVTNKSRIVSDFSQRNSGENQAALYTLGFGEDADHNFLRKLSLRNDGFMRHIYEASDAEMQLRDFYQQVSSPLLSHVQFVYPLEQIKRDTVSRNEFRIINAGSEVVVVGQIAEDATELTPQVVGFYATEDGLGRIRYEVFPRVTVPCRQDRSLPMEKLWAYLTIKQLLDVRDAGDDNNTNTTSVAEKKALAISLKHSFVTPVTSLVVVKPKNATSSVDPKSVDKQPRQKNFALGAPTVQYDAGPSRSPAQSHVLSKRAAPRPASSVSKPSAESASGSSRTAIPDKSADKKASTSPIAPPVQTPSDVSPAPPAPVDSPDFDYHLEDFGWTAAILDKTIDALVFECNGYHVVLTVTKDVNPPKECDGDKKCPCSSTLVSQAAPDQNANAECLCVYLTRCNAARNITVDEYRDSSCFIDNRYAGVCCPKNEIDTVLNCGTASLQKYDNP